MTIRSMKLADILKLQEIHEKFYKSEFEFPNFARSYSCSFVVENADGEIVTAGGLRPILESVILTDKRQSVRQRREALLEILAASKHFGRQDGFNQIHAFVQENNWENHLRDLGFSDTKGLSLVLDI